jgi:uncharacterized membrane protein YeaQ/YmgE (transglycosylase-associated protein family)
MASVPIVLILGIILFGMLVGAAAQWLLRGPSAGVNWAVALAAGLIGSFIGGLLLSLVSGDGLELRVSGLLGSLVGAVIVTLAWRLWQMHKAPPAHGREPHR